MVSLCLAFRSVSVNTLGSSAPAASCCFPGLGRAPSAPSALRGGLYTLLTAENRNLGSGDKGDRPSVSVACPPGTAASRPARMRVPLAWAPVSVPWSPPHSELGVISCFLCPQCLWACHQVGSRPAELPHGWCVAVGGALCTWTVGHHSWP